MSVYDYVRNNFWMKVFALALAVLIYLAVKSVLLDDPSLIWNPLKTAELKPYSSIPVRLVINPDQGQGFKVVPPVVKVVVSGEPHVLAKLMDSKILVYARVDIAKAPLGSFPLEVVPIREISIESIQPPRVEIETIPTGVLLFPSPPPVQPPAISPTNNPASTTKTNAIATNDVSRTDP